VPALLDVCNLNIDFATAQGRASAVREVSCYIEAGEVLGLVGESGSGNRLPRCAFCACCRRKPEFGAGFSSTANRISVMYAGSVVETARAAQVFSSPADTHTQGLLNSVPSLRTDRSKLLRIIEGMVPAATLPPGCAFEPRCSRRLASCTAELPPLVGIAPGHFARCPVVAREVR